MSLQTAMVTAPAVAWILAYRRPGVAREWLPAAAAACVGAAPWLVANLFGGFPTFVSNWVAAPVSGGAAVWSNAGWFARSSLAQLFVYGGPPAIWMSLCAGIAIAAGGFIAAIRDRAPEPATYVRPRDIGWLVFGVVLTAFLLDAFSSAGSVRGWTVRYAAPVYPAAMLAFAAGIDWLWRSRSKALAFAAIALLVLPNLALYDLPNTRGRAALRAQLRGDRRMLAFLSSHGIGLIYGDYFDVYHYNFDARGTIAAIPSIPQLDYLGYEKALGHGPVRWAVVTSSSPAAPLARALRGTQPYDVGGMRLYLMRGTAADAASVPAMLRRSP
jgi:hypothetical protein